ncbi:MAG: hypothetical protein JF615_12945, partial [Asticcacaulis sp.]|nr:hypothetical protein [Asticcacaulis sp.]
ESRRLSGFAEYGRHILHASPDSWEKWADVSHNVVPLVRALVAEKTKDVVAQYNLPEVFTDSVTRDIHYLCMEAELADVHPPGFFAHLAYWYWAGHFPCGWNYHPLPNGHSLIIY